MPVTTGVVGDRDVVAALAARDMATERRRPAGPDRSHDLELAAAQVPAMARDVGVTMRGQDVRDLQVRPRHENRRGASRRWWGRQQRERARDVTDRLQGNAGIEGGGIELFVPEQNLDDADVG